MSKKKPKRTTVADVEARVTQLEEAMCYRSEQHNRELEVLRDKIRSLQSECERLKKCIDDKVKEHRQWHAAWIAFTKRMPPGVRPMIDGG